MPWGVIRIRRWLIMLPLVVLTAAVCGCLPEQQQRLKCEFEFLQTKADINLTGAAAPAFVAACMGQHGYVRHSFERDCELRNECYVPRWHSWFLRLLFDRGPSLPGV
jgi:hypothetical protein